ncbi:MAG: hypothetical protein IJ013_05910 [Bacteroidaceae bacterium]|nr:hypothetical protein [Bacteroidaceae bacterium]
MSFIAAFLTFLFFCHPNFLAAAVVILIIALLFAISPWAGVIVVAIIVAGIALALMEEH